MLPPREQPQTRTGVTLITWPSQTLPLSTPNAPAPQVIQQLIVVEALATKKNQALLHAYKRMLTTSAWHFAERSNSTRIKPSPAHGPHIQLIQAAVGRQLGQSISTMKKQLIGIWAVGHCSVCARRWSFGSSGEQPRPNVLDETH